VASISEIGYIVLKQDRAKTELSKCQELRARACNASVSTGKISTTEIGVPIFKSPGKHPRKQKQV
jgi:hypothetical protein